MLRWRSFQFNTFAIVLLCFPGQSPDTLKSEFKNIQTQFHSVGRAGLSAGSRFLRPTHSPEQRRNISHLWCISWTSLGKDVHLSALEHLSTSELSHHVPTLVVDCFDIFINCIIVCDGKVGIIKWLDHLRTVSTDGLFAPSTISWSWTNLKHPGRAPSMLQCSLSCQS